MTWIVPYEKLDEQQKNFIDNIDITRKNVWIKGFPGSGKSVLLAHTIRKIRLKEKNASILVVVFTHSLIKMFKSAIREMGYDEEVVTFFDFLGSNRCFDYILSDEIQDMTPRVLNAMNSRAKHVIVSGDSNQSIFDKDPKYREATVSPNQISSLLSANEFELGIIHRLSSSIINAVQMFLPRTNIFTARRQAMNNDTQIRLCEAFNSEEEVKYIYREAKKAINVGQTAAVLIPTQDKILDFFQTLLGAEGMNRWLIQTNKYGRTDYGELNRYLSKIGLPIQYVGNGYGEFSDNSKKISILTYHSSKGLDFDNVFLPYLNNSLFIVADETLSKTLFMVAMTRSKNNLYITYSGYGHSYLSNFSASCNKVNIHDALSGQNQFSNKANSSGNFFAGF